MSWARLDDSYDTNAKILELTEQQRWRWTRVLLHCARHRSDGLITVAVMKDLGLGRTIATLISVGLLDAGEDGIHRVHDWSEFNPKDPNAAARMQKRRSTVPSAEAGQWKRARRAVWERDHGICADCGKDCSEPSDDGRDVWNADHEPPREDLIAAGESIYNLRYIVTRCHSCHAKKTRRQSAERKRTQTEHESEHTTERQSEHDWLESEHETELDRDSRAAAGARPVPYPKDQDPSVLPAVVRDGQEGRKNLLDQDRLDPRTLLASFDEPPPF